MNDISALLQEAKPLYKERQKRRRQIKNTVAVLCVFMLGIFSYRLGEDNSLSYDIDEDLYITENGGFIEDMGLPTDEFGLLKVS